MQIILEDAQEMSADNMAFAIASYSLVRDQRNISPMINIKISRELWRKKMNNPSTKKMVEYLKSYAPTFISEKVNSGEIPFSDKPSPFIDKPLNYVIASEWYDLQENEILIGFKEFENQ